MLEKVGSKKSGRNKLRRSQSTSAERAIRDCIDGVYMGEADSFLDGKEARDDFDIYDPYFYSSHGLRTKSTSDETRSRASGKTEWSETTQETKYTKTSIGSWFSSKQSSVAQHQRRNYDFDNIASPTNSVGAVRSSKGGKAGTRKADFSPFDYIRHVTNKHFANPLRDPPSDKSMATSNSIRAEDAGSAFFKKGALSKKQQQKQQIELAQQILKRRQIQLMMMHAQAEP